MPDCNKIMDLLVQGHSYGQVQALAGCSHRAISKANRVLDEEQFSTREQLRDLSAEELDRFFRDGRRQAASQFVAIDVEAVLKARIGRKKLALTVLCARYLGSEGTGKTRFYWYE